MASFEDKLIVFYHLCNHLQSIHSEVTLGSNPVVQFNSFIFQNPWPLRVTNDRGFSAAIFTSFQLLICPKRVKSFFEYHSCLLFLKNLEFFFDPTKFNHMCVELTIYQVFTSQQFPSNKTLSSNQKYKLECFSIIIRTTSSQNVFCMEVNVLPLNLFIQFSTNLKISTFVDFLLYSPEVAASSIVKHRQY